MSSINLVGVIASDWRLRVRLLTAANETEKRGAWSNRLCLSTPHMGEALDMASDMFRKRVAVAMNRGAQILHIGHPFGSGCEAQGEAQTEIGAGAGLRGRCLILDYVPSSQEQDQDELDVSGLVAR